MNLSIHLAPSRSRATKQKKPCNNDRMASRSKPKTYEICPVRQVNLVLITMHSVLSESISLCLKIQRILFSLTLAWYSKKCCAVNAQLCMLLKVIFVIVKAAKESLK